MADDELKGQETAAEKQTGPEFIGHVAPSFDSDHITYNTLVIRPEYRISLRLGEIDRLFPWDISTKAGRLARLQVLGLFYWPLSHRVAAGKEAKPAGTRLADNQAGYTEAWKYFKEKFCGVSKASLDADAEAGNDKGEAELKKRLKEWVAQRCDGTADGSSYNTGGESTGGGLLPLPAEEDSKGKPKPDETEGHFAKLRFPGGWSFFKGTGGHDANQDPSMAGKGFALAMYDSVHVLEQKCCDINPGFGRIPLIAKVEERYGSDGEWRPASKVWVYFQLLKPYALPDFDSGRGVHQQLNRPPLIGSVYSVTNPTPPNYESGHGPKYFMEKLWDKYEYDKNTKNPQLNNCHEDCGGKRKTGNQEDGSDVKDILFKLGKVEGFSADHKDPPADILDDGKGKRVLDPAPKLNQVEEVTDAKHPHSVKTQTNDDGEAGVIFLPSRCSGDCYRIRAFIGPDTMAGSGSDGQGKQAVRVDTGTFVIWRNLRMSRFLRQKITASAQFNDKMVNQHFGRADGDPLGANDKRDWAKDFGLVNSSNNWVGLPDLEFEHLSEGKVGSVEDGIRVSFAKAFCEFETDPGFVPNEALTQDEWNAAVQCGLADAKLVFQPSNADANRFDLDTMLYREAANADINKVENGFIFPARNVAAYAAAVGNNSALLSGANANAWKGVIKGIFFSWLYSGFMRHVARNGYLPGVTIVQGAALTNLESEPGYGMGLFGIGTHFAGAFVMKGITVYATSIGSLPGTGYGYAACVAHEFGHVIFKVHAPGLDPGGGTAGGTRENRHDSNGNLTVAVAANDANGNPRGEPKHGTCLMSYRDCEGFFCARCLLQLRGWNILANKIQNDTRHP